MKTLSSFGLGSSVIAATITAATVVAIAPAQAAMLSGSVSLDGDAIIPDDGLTPATTTLVFEPAKLPIGTSGDFDQVLYPNDGSIRPMFEELELTHDSGNIYKTGNVTSFINFGEQTINGYTGNLTFDLFDSEVTRNRFSESQQIYVTIDGAKGQFVFNDETLATGFFSASRSGGTDDSSYQVTLKAVPEPLTTLGTGLALGFGGLFQRQRSGKGKNRKQS
jgi:hypothetical protein